MQNKIYFMVEDKSFTASYSRAGGVVSGMNGWMFAKFNLREQVSEGAISRLFQSGIMMQGFMRYGINRDGI